jgi:hypothetical protein
VPACFNDYYLLLCLMCRCRQHLEQERRSWEQRLQQDVEQQQQSLHDQQQQRLWSLQQQYEAQARDMLQGLQQELEVRVCVCVGRACVILALRNVALVCTCADAGLVMW